MLTRSLKQRVSQRAGMQFRSMGLERPGLITWASLPGAGFPAPRAFRCLAASPLVALSRAPPPSLPLITTDVAGHTLFPVSFHSTDQGAGSHGWREREVSTPTCWRWPGGRGWCPAGPPEGDRCALRTFLFPCHWMQVVCDGPVPRLPEVRTGRAAWRRGGAAGTRWRWPGAAPGCCAAAYSSPAFPPVV